MTQLFMIGPAPQTVRDAMQLAWESFDRVIACMKPGVSVGALLDAARVEGLGGRAVASVRLHGCGLGDDGPLADGEGELAPELAAQQLLQNCVVSVDAQVTLDGRHGYGRWGDSVVIGAGGAERFGSHPRQLYELQ